MTKDSFPRIVVGAVSSGTGKTTAAAGLMAAFRKRGLVVQPFKTGPDYIDPGFHTLAAGRESRNLDTRLMPRSAVIEIFRRAAKGSDVSVVEGVMGIFDGAGPLDEKGSTAHLAKTLDAPAVILLDVKGTARSAGATALGFTRFDRRLRVAGFILNRVGSPGHLSIVKTAVESATGLPVFGGLLTDENLKLPERHLGLVPAWEARSSAAAALRWRDYFASLAAVVESSLDLDALLAAARSAPRPPRGGVRLFGGMPDLTAPSPKAKNGAAPKKATAPKRAAASVKIAYALDDAFHFYYPDNLDILRRYGAELLPFSPTADGEVPKQASGIYLGGGYPELHAKKLAENIGMLDSIRSAALGGMPILAECGGFMYLSRSIRNFAGGDFPMAGLLPVRIRMEKKLRALGYYDGALLTDCILGRRGEVCPGHVFHWSSAEPVEDSAVRGGAVDAEGGPALQAVDADLAAPLFSLSKPGREPLTDGFALGNIAASYLHIHFASRPRWAKNFTEACRRYRRGLLQAGAAARVDTTDKNLKEK